MDTSHSLLQPDGVPWDVVIDHQPAELQVDAFARCFGRNKNLASIAELSLGTDTGAWRIAIADLHAAMNLRHREPPLTELAHRTAVTTIANQEVERVLMLREYEQLHRWVVKQTLFGQKFLEMSNLYLVLLGFKRLGPRNENAEISNLFSQVCGVVRDDDFFEFRDELLLLLLWQIVEVVRQSLIYLILAVLLGVLENTFTLFLHSLKATSHCIDA